jgi:FlaA1/EpsC-like NDP-sugar epimerase
MSKLSAPQRRLVLRLFLAAVIVFSLVTAFLLRFEYAIPRVELAHLWGGLGIALGVKLAVFYFSRCERGGWRYSGIADLYQLLRANLIASVAFTLAALAVYGGAFPRSVYCIDFKLCFLACLIYTTTSPRD